MHIARLLLCIVLILIARGGFDWYVNQPQDAGTDVPSGKLMSLSFAPFREGYSPLEEVFPLPSQIDEDLRLLADKTQSIRTYASTGGMEPVPDLARKYGLKMIQGGWLGYGHQDNKIEMEALIKSANANPDVVKRVIVGNEVLLRGEMSVDKLIDYIREVKRAVKQPVSYADVWSMYMKHPELIKEVDFITIHILPYWEDEPISVDHASEHLEKIVKQVEDEARGIAPGKPILIGESGWPSTGRQRGKAVPSVVNEAKFIRGMIQIANRHGFDYNIVEAFNQPWKSNLEGVVGANWGLFSANRKPVFPLTGPVSEDPAWLIRFAVAAVLWLLIFAIYFKRLQAMSFARQMLFLILVQALCACLVNLADFLWYTSYSQGQRAHTIFMVLANAIFGGLLIQRFYDVLTNNPGTMRLARWLRNAYLFFIFLALYKTYGLAVNGRYLSFPIEQFTIPALGVLGLIVCAMLTRHHSNSQLMTLDQLTGWNLHSRHDRLVAYFLSIGVVGLVLGEANAFLAGRDFIQAHPVFLEGLQFALSYTLCNRQLLSWLVCLLVLSIPFWTNTDRKSRR